MSSQRRRGSTAAPRLVLAEDDRPTQKAIAANLRRAGYEVFTADDGQSALDIISEIRPDAALLDICMPHITGVEICRQIRASGNDMMAIIMLTGLHDAASVEEAFEAGADDFVSKPVPFPLLLQRIRFCTRTHGLVATLTRQHERLRQAHRIARLGFWEMDDDGTVTPSEELSQLLGRPDPADTMSLEELASLAGRDGDTLVRCVMETLSSGKSFELEHIFKNDDGLKLLVRHRGTRVESRTTRATVVGTVFDVTEQKRTEAALRFQSNHDPGTRLPNAQHFQEHIAREIESANDGAHSLAVVVIGFDGLAEVTTSFGQIVSDVVLRLAADRVKAVGLDDDVARIGDDVLALSIRGADHEALKGTLDELLTVLGAGFCTANTKLFLKPSIGVARSGVDADDALGLLSASRTALIRARSTGGRRFELHSPVMSERNARRIKLMNDLPSAIQESRLDLHYHPKIAASSRRLVGAEALVRWTHPELGVVTPDEFIPIAEQSGHIVALGRWVLDTACRAAKAWQAAGIGTPHVAINVSAVQLAHSDVAADVERALSASGLAPERLEVEVTESAAIADIEACSSVLAALRSLGVTTAMDDFGTGYSSLSQLKRLPLDAVKVDRAFVSEIGPGGENSEVARAIIGLADALGLVTVAEGVEKGHQLSFLSGLGCQVFQGFLFSRPLPEDMFCKFAHAWPH